VGAGERDDRGPVRLGDRGGLEQRRHAAHERDREQHVGLGLGRGGDELEVGVREGVGGDAEAEEARLHVLGEEMRGRAGPEAIDPAGAVHGLRGALDVGGHELALPFREHRGHAADHVADTSAALSSPETLRWR
jgi:hypothetical protein